MSDYSFKYKTTPRPGVMVQIRLSLFSAVPSIHLSSIPLILLRVVGELEPITADIGQEAGSTLIGSPVCHKVYIQRERTILTQPTGCPIVQCLWTVGGSQRKPRETPEKTPADRERTCTLHTERPGPYSLWGVFLLCQCTFICTLLRVLDQTGWGQLWHRM